MRWLLWAVLGTSITAAAAPGAKPKSPRPAPSADVLVPAIVEAEPAAARAADRHDRLSLGFGPGSGARGGAPMFRLTAGWMREWALSDRLALQAGVAAGFWSWGSRFSSLFLTYETAIAGFDAIPAGRLVVRATDRVRFYGHLGLGVSYVRETTPVVYLGNLVEATVGPALRFALGLEVKANENVGLFIEPLGVSAFTLPASTLSFGGVPLTLSGGFVGQYVLLLGGVVRL
jgi:hypothetical protein